MLEILQPRHDLSAVGGLDHAVAELREVADIMRRGLHAAAPLGIILMGPPGTGKSYLAECFAKECGMLCVQVPAAARDVRRAVGAEPGEGLRRHPRPRPRGGDRGRVRPGGGRQPRPGVRRLRGDGADARGRVQLLGRQRAARQGAAHRQHEPRGPHRLRDAPVRAHRHQDPDPHAGRGRAAPDLRGRGAQAQAASTITDYTPFAERTDGYTGSDIELAVTTAYRFALRDGAKGITDAHLTAALDDLLPTSRDQAAIDRMTILALDECRNKRLLPRNHEQIRRGDRGPPPGPGRKIGLGRRHTRRKR